MKKCQNCIANNNNMFCNLEYKTEKKTTLFKGYNYEFISPIEKCKKPKNKKEYHFMIKKILRNQL